MFDHPASARAVQACCPPTDVPSEVGSGLALPPVWDAGRVGLKGAQVGDELSDLLVGERAAGDEEAHLLIRGGGEELLGVQRGGAAAGRGAPVAGGAVVGEQPFPEAGVGALLVARGAGTQARFLDPVEHKPEDQDHHEHKTPRVVTIQAALQPFGFEGGRLGSIPGHGHLLVMQAGPSGGVRKSRFPRSGPGMSVPVSTTNMPLSSRSSKRSIPRGAGPWTYSPAMSYTEPWQGHSNRPEVLQNGTRQPRCGHFWDRAKKCPPALASQSRPSLK